MPLSAKAGGVHVEEAGEALEGPESFESSVQCPHKVNIGSQRGRGMAIYWPSIKAAGQACYDRRVPSLFPGWESRWFGKVMDSRSGLPWKWSALLLFRHYDWFEAGGVALLCSTTPAKKCQYSQAYHTRGLSRLHRRLVLADPMNIHPRNFLF